MIKITDVGHTVGGSRTLTISLDGFGDMVLKRVLLSDNRIYWRIVHFPDVSGGITKWVEDNLPPTDRMLYKVGSKELDSPYSYLFFLGVYVLNLGMKQVLEDVKEWDNSQPRAGLSMKYHKQIDNVWEEHHNP